MRSFADGNGDGIGRSAGVRSRLPYLADLGVDAIWLTPFYASPQADGGYDVADYRDVDPIFGTLADADGADRRRPPARPAGHRRRGPQPHLRPARLVPARRSPTGPGSAARERYHFRPGKGADGELPPNDWESVFGGPAWTRLDPTGEWYLHLFAPEQPDFNWEHPEVRDEFESVLRFWLDLGVDGFRIDVAHGMVKAPGLPDVGRAGQVRAARHRGAAVLRPGRRARDLPRLAARSSTRTPGSGSASPRRGRPPPSGSPATSARTSCTRRSTSSTSAPRGTRPRCAQVIDESLAAIGLGRRPHHLGALQPRRQPARHPVRRRRARAAPGPRGGPADARAARLRLHLPGRGAGPARGARPAGRGPPGPARLRGARPGGRRRLPGADPVDRHGGRRTASAAGRQLAAAAATTGRAAQRRGPDRRPGLHAGAVPRRRSRSAGSSPAWATARWPGWTPRRACSAFRRGDARCLHGQHDARSGSSSAAGPGAAAVLASRRPDGRRRRRARLAPDSAAWWWRDLTPSGTVRSMSRTRLADIAAQAGVSEATVSRVLNGKPGVSAATRAVRAGRARRAGLRAARSGCGSAARAGRPGHPRAGQPDLPGVRAGHRAGADPARLHPGAVHPDARAARPRTS